MKDGTRNTSDMGPGIELESEVSKLKAVVSANVSSFAVFPKKVEDFSAEAPKLNFDERISSQTATPSPIKPESMRIVKYQIKRHHAGLQT